MHRSHRMQSRRRTAFLHPQKHLQGLSAQVMGCPSQAWELGATSTETLGPRRAGELG